MAVYLLEGYNTDSRYPNDVRYREYTTSKKKAELFNKIPKIQFSDSGHGICFSATEHRGHRKPHRTELSNYVFEQMAKLTPPKANKPKRHSLKYILRKLISEKCMCPIKDGDPPFEWAISETTMQEAIEILRDVEG